MTYHILENDNGWTMIHESDCPTANQGKGTQPDRRGEQTRWHGPYPTYQDAYNAAKKMKDSVNPCETCKPSEPSTVQ